jgi:quinohemoprotein ethanol dehydrogenase
MNRRTRISAGVVAAAALIGAIGSYVEGKDAVGTPLEDHGAGADWAGPGGTYGEQHFSALSQIDEHSVGRLGLAWSIALPPGNSVSAPLAIGGTLYFVTGYGVVHAADAVTGKLLWEYDPETYKYAGHKLRLGWGSRGIAWWNGKIYVAPQDGRLIALDARTGQPVWTAQTLPADDTTYITGAPRILDGKVIIGFGGADYGPNRGYVTTYDAETGKLLWRWYTVPGDPSKGFENEAMAKAARSWSGEWWKLGGGGTVWNAMSYDPETRTVFIGTGNGSPWNRKARSEGKGDNLYLASVVALDADTGKYKWHYQVNPGESWDYTATMDMEFADLRIGDRVRKVLMTAPKNGFFYVIDRITGQLISAEPIARVNWATKIDLATGRPVENPAARYPEGTTFTMWPSGTGAHNWYPMAFSPQTKLVYIPVIERAMTWTDWELGGGRWRQLQPVGTIQSATMNSLPDLADPLNRTSRLVAWDPVAQKQVWSQPTPATEGGSLMATAGNLVFQGQLDGRFNAYAADTGKLLWSFRANAPVLAPPITYMAGGRQYVSVLTGITGHTGLAGADLARFNIDYRTLDRRMLTFVLGGSAKLAPVHPQPIAAIDDPDYTANAAKAGRGMMTFSQYCSACHGFFAIAGGSAPDLRTSGVILTADAFRQVVHEGALMPNGMPRFEELTNGQLDDIRQYLRSRAAELRAAPPASADAGATKGKPTHAAR